MMGLGIVAEYNPFHNGHAYHLKESKRKINPDFTVIIMSGNWVQRGLPAIMDKWTRTEVALQQGADLVIELPFIWATQSASQFAFGSVYLLKSLGITHYQTFGSESGNISKLSLLAKKLVQEPPEFKNTLKQNLEQGKTYSQSISNALGLSELQSNDILAIEYLKNQIKLNAMFTSHAIPRIGSDYLEEEAEGEFSSATAIRKAIREDNMSLAKKSLPNKSFDQIITAISENKIVDYTELEKFLLYKFRTTDTKNIRELTEWEPGLEQRAKKAAMTSSTLEEFMDNLKTKRYTRTRINRFCLHALLNLKREEVSRFNSYGPPYIRILGMNKKGQTALKQISENSYLPIITRPGRDLRNTSLLCQNCFEWEVKSTAFYNLLKGRGGDEEYKRPPVIPGDLY